MHLLLHSKKNSAEDPNPDPSIGTHRCGRQDKAHQVGPDRGEAGSLLHLPENDRRR